MVAFKCIPSRMGIFKPQANFILAVFAISFCGIGNAFLFNFMSLQSRGDYILTRHATQAIHIPSDRCPVTGNAGG